LIRPIDGDGDDQKEANPKRRRNKSRTPSGCANRGPFYEPNLPYWIVLGSDRPTFAFMGIWRPWTGTRDKEEAEHLLLGMCSGARLEMRRNNFC
jgi:hypothetical protein